MHPPRVWLITGASSGFGRALVEVVLRKSEIVVATLRKPSVLAPLTKQYPSSQLLVLPLDVTRPSDITAAFSRTQEVFGRIDVVFNNAGRGIFGEFESTSDADARALFEVNFWGKHAVDRFSESLSKELPLEWNIRICILQTGAFDTNVFAGGEYTLVHPAYTGTLTADLRGPYREMRRDGDPNKFAEMLYRLVANEGDDNKIPLFLPVGKDTLGILQGRLKRMNRLLVNTRSWSMDLRKDNNDKAMAKL